MTNCTQCGAELAAGASFCGACGAVVVPAATAHDHGPDAPDHDHPHGPAAHDHGHDDEHGHDHPHRPAAGAPVANQAFGGALNNWQSSASRPSVAGATSVINELKGSASGGRTPPQLALVTAAAAALIGLFLGISAIKALFASFGDDLFGRAFGASFKIALVLTAVVGVLVAALWLGIAWLIRGGSRVAIPLVYVAGAATALGDFTGSRFALGLHVLEILSGLLAVGVIALTFVPEVRGHLSAGATGSQAPSLAASEALLLFFGAVSVLLGISALLIALALSDFPYASIGNFYVVAVGMVAAGVAALVFARAVGRGDVKARLIISGDAAAFFVLMIVGGNLGGAWFQVVTIGGVAALLWLAPDARAAFGDTPLDVSKLQGGAGTPQAPPSSYEQPAPQQTEPPVV